MTPADTAPPTAPQTDDRLIVPLDFPNALMGLEMAQTLGPEVSFYKIGLEMLMGGGLALARELIDEYDKRIFLDMKLFDISNTIRGAVRNLKDYGPDFLTVHGDPHVVAAAAEGKAGSNLKILAVTILTSLDRSDLDAALIAPGDVHDLVVERARRAMAAGADGVIASPREAAAIRALPEATGKLIVTPGVRPRGAALGDQKDLIPMLFNSLDIAMSGASLSRMWMDAISDNVANANTVRPADEEPFRARLVVARSVRDAGGTARGVTVDSIVESNQIPIQTYDPHNPLADENGLVTRPVVDLGQQMTDLILASRSYEANLSVIDRVRDTYMAALRIGQ